jgi:hypothetical protein
VAAAALAVGGLVGSAVTEWVGHLLAGGRDTGAVNTIVTHLPLSVHMRGLLMLEGAAAVLVYSLFAAFAQDDDLGRPEAGPGSVGVGGQPDHPWGHGDGAGALQQAYLPPQ